MAIAVSRVVKSTPGAAGEALARHFRHNPKLLEGVWGRKGVKVRRWEDREGFIVGARGLLQTCGIWITKMAGTSLAATFKVVAPSFMRIKKKISQEPMPLYVLYF